MSGGGDLAGVSPATLHVASPTAGTYRQAFTDRAGILCSHYFQVITILMPTGPF